MMDPIGSQLRQAREARGLSIEEAALVTHIRARFLLALEEGRQDDLPSLVQARGFLRNYAEYLGLPAEALVESWAGKTAEPAAPEPAQPPAVKKPGRKRAFLAEPEPALPPVYIAPASSTPISADSLSAPIFQEIGQTLRIQRELLGLSLIEVERYTHVRMHYLKALETGQIDTLPSPVQARGMLSNYATFLNLDLDALLNRFADGLQTRREERLEAIPADKRPGASRRIPGDPVKVDGVREPRQASPFSRFFSIDLLLGAGMVIFLVAFAVYAATRVAANTNQNRITPDAPGISEVLLSSETVAPSATPSPPPQGTAPVVAGVEGTQIAETQALPTASSQGEIQLVVVARSQAWLQVSVDNRVEFQGRTQPGSAYPFAGNNRVELVTGNAAALQVFYNESDLGSLGGWSEVVRLVFTGEGIVTPTPTVTPTATRTQRVTPGLPTATSQP